MRIWQRVIGIYLSLPISLRSNNCWFALARVRVWLFFSCSSYWQKMGGSDGEYPVRKPIIRVDFARKKSSIEKENRGILIGTLLVCTFIISLFVARQCSNKNWNWIVEIDFRTFSNWLFEWKLFCPQAIFLSFEQKTGSGGEIFNVVSARVSPAVRPVFSTD